MAKPKLPKKTNGLNQSVPAPTIPVPQDSKYESTPETSFASTEAFTAVTATEAKTAVAKKTEARKPARKPEIVRTERANLVPINLEDEIRRFAYLLSERRGFEPGHEAEDWLAAEREIRQRYHQQSA